MSFGIPKKSPIINTGFSIFIFSINSPSLSNKYIFFHYSYIHPINRKINFINIYTWEWVFDVLFIIFFNDIDNNVDISFLTMGYLYQILFLSILEELVFLFKYKSNLIFFLNPFDTKKACIIELIAISNLPE